MRKLEFYNPDPAAHLVWPNESRDVNLDSSALTVFTDFKENRPLVIDAHCSAIEAERLMLEEHVRLKLVINADRDFLGVVSLADLNSQELLKKVAKGFSRNELKVVDFMRPRESLRVLDYEEVARSTVADLVETLKGNYQQHCLVIDRSSHEIRGVVSASDLARRLRLPLDINRNSSFFGIFTALHA